MSAEEHVLSPLLINACMSRMAPMLDVRQATAHACCGRQQVCRPVQVLREVEGRLFDSRDPVRQTCVKWTLVLVCNNPRPLDKACTAHAGCWLAILSPSNDAMQNI